jgi:hypothetical protein
MSTKTDKTRCIICEKEKRTLNCSGCLVNFCFNYLVEYRQQLSKRWDESETKRNLFDNHFPSQLSPNESPGNPHQNSTGESRQGFPRDLRGSEGESLGICKGVKGSP